jgi:hypothetical protein
VLIRNYIYSSMKILTINRQELYEKCGQCNCNVGRRIHDTYRNFEENM